MLIRRWIERREEFFESIRGAENIIIEAEIRNPENSERDRIRVVNSSGWERGIYYVREVFNENELRRLHRRNWADKCRGLDIDSLLNLLKRNIIACQEFRDKPGYFRVSKRKYIPRFERFVGRATLSKDF